MKKGLPDARGRVSWDPVVADPPIRGVQSETGLTGDRRSGGATSEERGEKQARCAGTDYLRSLEYGTSKERPNYLVAER